MPFSMEPKTNGELINKQCWHWCEKSKEWRCGRLFQFSQDYDLAVGGKPMPIPIAIVEDVISGKILSLHVCYVRFSYPADLNAYSQD